MSDCKVVSVIRTNLLRRGNGVDGDPLRIITQYWSMDGNLLWEFDPVEFRRNYNDALPDDSKLPEN